MVQAWGGRNSRDFRTCGRLRAGDRVTPDTGTKAPPDAAIVRALNLRISRLLPGAETLPGGALPVRPPCWPKACHTPGVRTPVAPENREPLLDEVASRGSALTDQRKVIAAPSVPQEAR